MEKSHSDFPIYERPIYPQLTKFQEIKLRIGMWALAQAEKLENK